MDVDQQRLREDIESNGGFGAVNTDHGRGRTTLTGSEANRRARDYFVDRARERDLQVTVDAVGNVTARWSPKSADSDAAPVAAGSHLDSVPEGGIFDGPLGVYAALESVRAMQDSGMEPHRPIEVVCFTEEEGHRFGNGLLGSSVATGALDVHEALTLTDEAGTTLEAALEKINYRGHGRLDAGRWNAWLELHVEQGRRLERADAVAGVVDTIAGITHCFVEIEGTADHAGSTPMDERLDALVAASELVLDVADLARTRAVTDPDGDEHDRSHDGPNSDAEDRSLGSDTVVGTVGTVDVSPNATNVIPGRVDLGIDIRDVSQETIDEFVDRIDVKLDRLETVYGIDSDLSRPYDRPPTPMSDRCRDALARAADRSNVPTETIYSGAAHDTMNLASVTDVGLLFAPSRDGVSHNPMEWTDWADCADATRVLAGALFELSLRE